MNTFGTYLYVELPSQQLDSTTSIMLPMAHPDAIVLAQPNSGSYKSEKRGIVWFLQLQSDVSQTVAHVKKEYPGSNAMITLEGVDMALDTLLSNLYGALQSLTANDVLIVHLSGSSLLSDVTACVRVICEVNQDLEVFHLRGTKSHFMVVKHSSLVEAPDLPKLTPPEIKFSPTADHVTSEIILISKNRPLQTLAFLESLNELVSGIKKVWILYTVANARFLAGYEKAVKCSKSYFAVEMVDDSGDLGGVLLNVLKASDSKCMMLAVDEMIWLQRTELEFHCNLLALNEEVATVQFRLGRSLGAYPRGRRKEILEKRVHLVNESHDLFLYYPAHWPYDFGYVLHIDGYFTRRLELLTDIENLGHVPKSPGGIENGMISKHLHKYIRRWHIMNGTPNLVNNMSLKDGRVAGAKDTSSGSKDLLETLLDKNLKIDVEEFRRKHRNGVVGTHLSLNVDFIKNRCTD